MRSGWSTFTSSSFQFSITAEATSNKGPTLLEKKPGWSIDIAPCDNQKPPLIWLYFYFFNELISSLLLTLIHPHASLLVLQLFICNLFDWLKIKMREKYQNPFMLIHEIPIKLCDGHVYLTYTNKHELLWQTYPGYN